MQVEKAEGGTEKLLLVALITDKPVLSKIAPHWKDEGLFRSRWANVVGSWCITYYRKYHKAPKKEIVHLFSTWQEGSEDQPKPDKATAQLVESFLEGVSHEYSNNKRKENSKFIIDQAASYFHEVQLEKLVEDVKSKLAAGKLSQADKKVHSFRKIEVGMESTDSFLKDKSSVKDALSKKSDARPLITFPEPADKMFGDAFCPDSFIAFMGKTGVGKSFWLLKILFIMLAAGKRCLYISTGDMSRRQVHRRVISMVAQRPLKAGKYLYPRAIHTYPEDAFAEVEYDHKVAKRDLDYKSAVKAIKKFVADDLGGDGDLFRMSVHPGFSINALSIQYMLEEEARLGFRADCALIDYMDLLSPMPGYSIADDRGNINSLWGHMRSISQKMNLCIVTATQSDTPSYNAKILTRSNFTDSRKKLDHMSDCLGLNQLDEEKDRGVYRINRIKARNEDYNETRCLHVASCLAISDPMICSTF